MKYRLRPVVVEAIQAVEGRMSLIRGVSRDDDRQEWILKTHEGDMEVLPGDWIITGMMNDHFLIQDGQFQMIYEPVEEEAMVDG